MSDPRWEVLVKARPILVEALRHVGVVRIEYVSAFPHQDSFYVWLGTDTDGERDALPTNDPHVDEVRKVLIEVGFPPEKLHGLGTTAQSQETVDREHEGSWFYALR